MATYSSFLAWRLPWTEEPGGLQSIGLQRVGQDLETKQQQQQQKLQQVCIFGLLSVVFVYQFASGLNNVPQTGWHKTPAIHDRVVLEVRSLKSSVGGESERESVVCLSPSFWQLPTVLVLFDCCHITFSLFASVSVSKFLSCYKNITHWIVAHYIPL